MGHDVREVLALLVDHVWEVDREARLSVAEDEAVRETAAVHAVQRGGAVGPLLGERDAVAANEFVARAPHIVGAYLEAGGVHDAIEFVLNAIDHNAALSDALNALSVGIDQRDIAAVEGWQVVVVKTGALAELAVIRLERFGGCGIVHDGVNA